jgi:hypothetical protein
MGKKKGVKAWLVTWDHSGDHAKPNKKIAAILNPRWSADKVREYVEILYASSEYNFSERIAYASNPKRNPYPAEFSRVKGTRWLGQITCGHNPWLFARKVENLHTIDNNENEESVSWNEIPIPNFPKI